MDKTLQDYISEPELIEWLRINQKQMNYVRNKGLRFVAITNRIRVYRVADLVEFFERNVVGKAEEEHE